MVLASFFHGMFPKPRCSIFVFGQGVLFKFIVYILPYTCQVASETSSPGIAARALACCADMLGTLARGRGGLRSGPGRNQLFQDAFEVVV